VHSTLCDARQLFHELIAERFSEVLSKHLQDIPQESLSEKRALARHANEELRQLGLSFEERGVPANLLADPGRHPDTGRFQLDLMREGEGSRVSRSKLGSIHLTMRPQREEFFSKYRRGKPQER
jgi:hypothetical protein